MSKFVQKTLHSLNAVLNNSGMFHTERDKLLSARNLEISVFVSKMKKVESKQEEEEIVNQYFLRIEKRLSDPDVSSAEVEEIVKICMVCETMGYKADFIYVHSLKLAQKGTLQQKHTGYMSAAFFLHPNHELVILLINTLQKDLSSSNHLEVNLALSAVCHLINGENVHNIIHLVEEKLQHSVPSVRKSSILTLLHCLRLINSESSYQMALPKLERSLSDPELEVVSVIVPTIHSVIKELSGDFSYLIDSLLQLLDQILMRRIPHCLNYSDIPAPWLQIDILKLLKFLCRTKENSSRIVPVLKKILVQTGVYHTIAQAIVYQVIETIASIEADSEILELAMSSVSLLLKSRDVNMKFMGLEALVLLMKRIEPNITSSQQDIIIDCLKLPDETLQLKTLELMYHLANPSNVQAICKKMIEFLNQMKESQKKKDLAMKILLLAEKYQNQHEWYISIINVVLLKVDNLLESSDICQIINIIEKDDELRKIAKKQLIRVIKENKCVPSSLIKIYSSVISTPAEFISIIPLLQSSAENDLPWLLSSLMESLLKFRSISPDCITVLNNLQKQYEDSPVVHLFLQHLLQAAENIADIKEFNVNVKVDPSLTCLDNFVLEFLQKSKSCYEPPSLRSTSVTVDPSTLNLTENSICIVSTPAKSNSPNLDSSFSVKSPSYSIFSSPSISFQSISSDVESFSPYLQKKAIWTKEGRSKLVQERISPEESNKKVLKEEDEHHQLFAGVK